MHNKSANREKDDMALCGSRPPSARNLASSKRGTHTYKKAGATSYIDETLFGSPGSLQEPDFSPPWKEKKSSGPPLLWSPAPTSSQPSSTKAGTPRKFRKIKFKPSFCDESLFGPPLQEPDFKAPWDKPDKRPRPISFDTSFTSTRTRAVTHETPDRDQSSGMATHRPFSGRVDSAQTRQAYSGMLYHPGSRSHVRQPTPGSAGPRPPWK